VAGAGHGFGRTLCGRAHQGSTDSRPGHLLCEGTRIGVPIPEDRSLLRHRRDPGSDSTIRCFASRARVDRRPAFTSRQLVPRPPAASLRVLACAVRRGCRISPRRRRSVVDLSNHGGAAHIDSACRRAGRAHSRTSLWLYPTPSTYATATGGSESEPRLLRALACRVDPLFGLPARSSSGPNLRPIGDSALGPGSVGLLHPSRRSSVGPTP
jgi:hypothetical protein